MKPGPARAISLVTATAMVCLAVGATPASANKIKLKKPRVSQNGAVHKPSYSIGGDRDGFYVSAKFKVTSRGHKVRWWDGKKLPPGTYRMTLTAKGHPRAFYKSMSEEALWKTKSALIPGWVYRISKPTFSTEFEDQSNSLPATVVHNGDPSRPDQPVHRYYFARYSETCGKYYPYFACYGYYDENSVKKEVPVDQAEILDLTKVPGSGYYGWKPEYLWPYAGVLAPTGTYWVYNAYSWTERVPVRFTANATRTYRHLATGTKYVAEVSKTGSVNRWGSLERFRKYYDTDDFFDLGTVRLTQRGKRKVGKASVRFVVKPPPPLKPKRTPNDEDPGVYYANCTEVRNAGAAPIYRGEPGYAPHLDRDGDGVGCE